MKKLSLLLFLSFATSVFAQFTTPGNGTAYTLQSLSAAAPTVLIDNGVDYTLTSNLTVSAGDILTINEETVLKIDPNIQLTIAGNYITETNIFKVTATNPAAVFRGILFEATATADLKNTTFEYGGGIRVSTGNFVMDNCIVQFFESGLVTGSALSFSTGNPVVKNSQFIENQLPAFSSGANQSVAITIENNYLYGNTKENSNRPQINMGPSGTGTTKIINNTIIGNRTLTRVGGVSASTLLGVENHVQIENNTIKDNRYGITITGNNSTGTISGNILEKNNTEPVPNNGGSGISLYGSTASSIIMNIKVRNNQIRENLWGITLIGNANADLGTPEEAGNNIFFNNGNNGQLYALYNNTALLVNAVNNCWRENEMSTEAMVEAVISHQPDDSDLGLVTFSPFLCADLAVNDITKNTIKTYPNPSKGLFYVETLGDGNFVISDFSGKWLQSGILKKGKNTVSTQLPKGIYLLTTTVNAQKISSKIMVE